MSYFLCVGAWVAESSQSKDRTCLIGWISSNYWNLSKRSPCILLDMLGGYGKNDFELFYSLY